MPFTAIAAAVAMFMSPVAVNSPAAQTSTYQTSAYTDVSATSQNTVLTVAPNLSVTTDSSYIDTTNNTLVQSDNTSVATTTVMTRNDVRNIVKAYFKDTPVLSDIAFCESTYRQFASNGQIVRGKVNKSDIGVMQINEAYHADTAAKLGMDLYTLEGNLEYGKYLYDHEGTTPWNSSKPCWGSIES